MAHILGIPVTVLAQTRVGTWAIDDSSEAGLLVQTTNFINTRLDGVMLRDAFTATPPNGKDLLRFVNEYGIADIAEPVDEGVGYSEREITIDILLEWRRLIPTLLVTPIANWSKLKGFQRSTLRMVRAFLERGPFVEFDLSGPVPKAIALASTGLLEACVLVGFLERLRGDKYRKCARPDCPNVFRRETRHKRKFCNWYCGHLVSVRRTRKDKRKSAAKQQRGLG